MYKKRALLFLVGILLSFALLSQVDIHEFIGVTRRLSLKWILVLAGLQLFMLFLIGLRWYVIIRRYGVSFMNVMHTSMIGLLINSLTPVSYAGGEPVRAYIISKIDKIKTEKAFATVFVDLFLSLVPSLLINLLAVILVFKNSMDIRVAWILIIIGSIITALFIAAMSVLRSQEPSLKLFKRILSAFAKIRILKPHVKSVDSKVDELFASFHRGIKKTVNSKTMLITCLMISTTIWVLTIVRVYLTFIALGYPLDMETVIIVYAVLVSVSLLPLLPGALGMWEWIGTGLFTYFGVPFEVAVAMVLIDRVFFYWTPIGVGVVSSFFVGLNIRGYIDESDSNPL